VILYVVRHARTEAAHGPVGRRDVPLAGTHEAAAAAILAALAAQEAHPARVYSSPLSRCARTARLVAATLSLPCVEDPRLLEIDYGAWEGVPWDELPRAATDAWARAWETEGPPGGESAQALEARVAAWLAEVRSAETTAAALLVAHAGVVRALRVLLLPEAWPEAMATPVPHAGDAGAVAVFRA
jgi:alpha-ribazole phosphatase